MHTLILGMTGSGKTYKTIEAVEKHLELGNQVVVYNPLRQKYPEHDNLKMFATANAFYQHIAETEYTNKILMVIDETPTILKEMGDKTLHTFLSTARHKGEVYMLGQRAKVIISETIKSQCSNYIIFKLNNKIDIQFLNDMFNFEQKEKIIENIPKFGYIYQKV